MEGEELIDGPHSEGPFGNILKTLTRKKVDLKKGMFGVALDRSDLRGSVANLLTDTWRGLQRLGTAGMDAYASPLTMSSRRTEAPTALTISISGVTSRVFNLIPPKAYIFTQDPASQIPDETKKANIIIVPGLILRIFRLVDNDKAPKTERFISVDSKEGTLVPKPFTIKMGDNTVLSPLYMPPDRINELTQAGGNSTAIVFPRKPIGSGDVTLTDSLLRSQGGALMLILDKERLQWVVSVEFSPFYEELQQQQSAGAGASLTRTTVLVPPAPKDTPAPPANIAATTVASRGTINASSTLPVKSKVRVSFTNKMYTYVISGNTTEAMKPLEFDFRNYPNVNLIAQTTTNDITLSVISATVGLALVSFSQQPAAISLFAEKNVFNRAQNITALLKQVDRVLLAMDNACLRLVPDLMKINTLKNNWLLGATYLLASIYLKHNGQRMTDKREMKAEALLPTWNKDFIPLADANEYASFPKELFTSSKEASKNVAKIMESLPALDSLAHVTILNKYATARYLTGFESDAELMTYITKRMQIDVTAIIKIAIFNNHGQKDHLPALIHIMTCLYQAMGAYFLREATLQEEAIGMLITACTNAKTDKHVEELKRNMLSNLLSIRQKENIKEPDVI